MKLAATLSSIEMIEQYIQAGTDIFIVGNERFANRLHQSFTNEELHQIIQKVHASNKEVYLNMNLIMHESDIEKVNSFLSEFGPRSDGIIFGDLGVFMMARKKQLEAKLIYHPETLNTNYYDTTFWHKKGIKGITISKEITLDDITYIGSNKELEVSIIGHGHLNMFHSRRPLIENYFEYTNQPSEEYINNRNLHLVEEIRNEDYPVFQDSKGTHIFREKAIESFKEILSIKDIVDVFIIDGIFKQNQYMVDTIKHYKYILENQDIEYAVKTSNSYIETHDSGFLFKKTKYDKM